MTTLHATPYNIDAAGFYFESAMDYEAKSAMHVDRYGNLVEEFEIQFIDGDDAQLFEVCGINQANLNAWFEDIEFLHDNQKVSLYYLVGCVGYTLDQALEKLEEPNISEISLRDAAEEFFDECWLHSVPESVSYYIDYDKFARDCELGGDMVEFEYAGKTYTCTNSNAL